MSTGVYASTIHKWNKLNAENTDEDVRVMTRKSIDDPVEPPGIVVCGYFSLVTSATPKIA